MITVRADEEGEGEGETWLKKWGAEMAIEKKETLGEGVGGGGGGGGVGNMDMRAGGRASSQIHII